MNLTTKQVSEKLGISMVRVHSLIKTGALTDVKPRTDGARKHFPLVDSKQLSEFAKTNKHLLQGRITKKRAQAANGHMNGHAEVSKGAVAPTAGGPGLLTKIQDQMTRIEAKLDSLLAMWR